jgi:hypothetical protein
MDRYIIGISGKRGTGKTALANLLEAKYGWIQLPFAALLKKKCRDEFGLTCDHTDGELKEVVLPEYKKTPREIMISMGQWYRSIDKLFWVKKTFEAINFRNVGWQKFVISDVRFVNEADYLQMNNAFLVRLERHQNLNIYKEPSNDISETDLDYYPDFDYIIPPNRNIDMKDLEYWAEMINMGVDNEIKGNAISIL